MTPEHISYIIKDLNYRGIVLEGFQEEIIDHVCSAVEEEMSKGKNFVEAYQCVLQSFGHVSGLREIQKQTLQIDNRKTTTMLKNYLTIAYRNLRRQRFFTLINICGLAIGMASCLVILLFVADELGYDRFNKKAERTFRLNTEIKFGANHFILGSGAASLAELLPQSYPEIEQLVRLRSWGPRFVSATGDVQRAKENVLWADSSFFSVFSIPILKGDPTTALKHPNTVAISRKMAAKYFPKTDPIGQSLILDKNWNHKVTAVFEDMPLNSHFRADLLVAMAALEEARSVSLVGGADDFHLYLVLRDPAQAKTLEAKFPAFVAQHVGPQIGAAIGGDFTMEKFHREGNKWEYTLTPLTDIHLHSSLIGELEANGNILYVYLFSAIALFILIIACINFMNMSTARSANRAREVGIRKVMGSMRSHLIRQFLTEAFLLSLIAFALAVLLSWLFLPTFNDLAQKELVMPFRSPSFYGILFLATAIVGVLSGLYPAFFLSAFKPVNVLKGNAALGMKSSTVRSVLVTLQFVVSILLIIGTITVQRQLQFIQDKDLGFQREQILVVKEASGLENNARTFKDEVLKNNFIISGTLSSYLPVSGTWRSSNTFWLEGVTPSQQNMNEMVNLQQWAIDLDYINTLGIKITSGRAFSSKMLTDSSAVILNETAVAQFNLGKDAIGKRIGTFNGQNPDGTPNRSKIAFWTVIGVAKDFHFESMKQNIGPLALFLHESNANISFRFQASHARDAVQAIEKTWKAMAPSHPFVYSFLDDDFQKMYVSEARLGKIVALFAGLAIAIACLGLFALTAFTAEQRTKEIGIRKVLGASVASVVFLLSSEFSKLILIAFVLAAPAAWLGIRWWLESYTYKVNVGWETYVGAGLLALIVTLFTMSYQSIRAAVANPAESLRTE